MSLSYDEAAFIAAHGRCATLGVDLAAELDGTDLAATGLGSAYHDERGEFVSCVGPFLPFHMQFADGHASVLTVSDASLTVHAEFPVGTFEPHRPDLLEPAAWRFRGGQQVRLRWSHPTDLAEAPLAWHDVGFHTGERGRPNRNGDNYFSLPPVIDGDELRLTIPAPAPITGPGLILFNLGESVGDATTCGGASRCDYRASRRYHHTVDIER